MFLAKLICQVILIVTLCAGVFASQFPNFDVPGATANDDMHLRMNLHQDKYNTYSEQLANFQTTVQDSIGQLHQKVDIVQGMLNEEKLRLNKLEWNNSDYFEDYEDFQRDFTEMLSEFRDSVDFVISQVTRAENMLAKDVGRLETVMETNSMTTARLLGTRRQKYSQSRLEVIDIVQDFMDLFSAGRRIINPFEAPGAGMDLIDVGVRMGMKFATKALNAGLEKVVEELGGGLEIKSSSAKARFNRISSLRNEVFQIQTLSG